MFQRQFVSELRRCEEMERQLSKSFVLYVYAFCVARVGVYSFCSIDLPNNVHIS